MPPALIRTVLMRVVGDGPVGRSIVGDLAEEFESRAQRSRTKARWWYRREAAGVLARSAMRRVRGQGAWERRPVSGPVHQTGDGMMGEWISEFRLAIRSLRRAPGFTTVTVLTLGLAIGSNAAVFSVVDGVLLKPLPFPDADRLVVFESSAPGVSTPPVFPVSPEFEAQYREAPSIEDLGLYRPFGGTLRLDDRVDRIAMATVSGTLFPTLSVQPVLGRLATEEELLAAPADRPVLLSHAVWQSYFGGDPGVLGRVEDIGGGMRTIIGVMGPDFDFPTGDTGAWIPFTVQNPQGFTGNFSWHLVGRMRDGATADKVLAQVRPLADRLQEDYASASRYVAFLRDGRYQPVVTPLLEDQVGDLRDPLWILLGTVGFVLLIACANVANLFLVRAETQQRDMAVRAAMGSGRARLIRGRMAEALVLAAAGCVLGIGLAGIGIPFLVGAAPDGIPRLDQVGLNATVLAFSAAVSVVAALLFGLLPAIHFTAPGLLSGLRSAGRGTARAGRRAPWRDALVVVQTALALILLVGSGLLVRSFDRLRNIDPGFDADGVLTFQYAPPASTYPTGVEDAALYTRFAEELLSLPGVASVGGTSILPLADRAAGTAFVFEGVPANGGLEPMLQFSFVTPGYFETMEIAVVAGRAFVSADHESPGGAVVVSRSLAERFWPGDDPLGKQLRPAGDTVQWRGVVGVVEDVRIEDLREEPQPMVYQPIIPREGLQAFRALSSPRVVVRAEDPMALVPLVRERLRALDASLPMYRVQSMEQVMADSVRRLSFTMIALSVAAAMALILGAVGLYGVLSYVVAQRTQEIGVRLALGAGKDQVLRMVVGQGAGLVAAGLVLGLVGAGLLSRILQGLLFGTEALDPVTFLAMAGVMFLVGLGASFVPARRAASVDPIRSMRME